MKPAGGGKIGRKGQTVEPDGGHCQALKHQCPLLRGELSKRLLLLKRLWTARFRSWKPASTLFFLTMNTKSQPALTGASRSISLSLRLSLFLTTALPIRRVAINPKRVSASLLGRVLNTRRLLTQTLPSVRIREKLRLLLNRWSLRMNFGHGLNGKPVASLETTPLEDVLASATPHTADEAVDSLTAADFGLVRTLGHSVSVS